ncbi:MAG: phosphoribosylanthranilate isomerase [Phycisphaerae bacterium]
MAFTRVKICGITCPDDALRAAECGADAIGLNFVGGPRKLTIPQATEILKVTLPLVEPVGLFNAGGLAHTGGEGDPPDAWAEIEWSIETKQWYGNVQGLEPWRWGPAGAPWWTVIHVSERATVAAIPAHLAGLRFRPQAVVLDVASGAKLGGTGESFNWRWITEARAAGELNGLPPIILAGGLTPENVADAIRIARPYAVDVSSGVEVPGKPGIKDPVKLRDFIQAAKAAL